MIFRRGNDYKWFLIIVFQNALMALKTPPLHGKCYFKFPFFHLSLGEPFKNYLADFARKGGGGWYPPFPLSFFEHNDCLLRGEGVPPNSVKEKIR